MSAFLAALLLSFAPAAQAVEVEPVLQAKLLGGQSFFGEEKAALTGNLSLLAAPAVRVNERWALLPTVSSRYQGTRRVLDLLGAGTLFQEQMDHRASLKAVYVRPDSLWRWKGSAGYRVQLLKETKDERWTRGLFDYQAAEFGLEAEYVYRDPLSLRLTWDYAYTFFPNYRSLESQAALDFQGQPLARELVGDRVLDTHANVLGAVLELPVVDAATAELSLRAMQVLYPRQPLVLETGLLSPRTRADYQTSAAASLRWPVEHAPDLHAVYSGGLSAAVLNSDQSSYDARRSRYLSRFYNYAQLGLGLSARLDWGDERQPVSAALGLALSSRRYPHRPTQDAAGSYRDESLRQDSWMLDASLRYPMAPRFSLLFELQHGRVSSNQGYSQFYRYDYTATSYLFGLQYDY